MYKEFEFNVWVGSQVNTEALAKGIRQACIDASEKYVEEHSGEYGMLGVEIFEPNSLIG